MTGIDGGSGLSAGQVRRAWMAVVTAIMLTFSLMATAVPAGAGEDGRHEEKVTICHAAGLEGTTHYITLTIGYSAAYGPAGHFYENGTTRAGHEQDYFGECEAEEPEANEASLTIVKRVVTSADQDAPEARFPFVVAAPDQTEAFELANGGSKTFGFTFDSDRFDVVVDEQTEDLPDGYSFVSASCVIGDRVIPQRARASVSLFDGADVTCTFLNSYENVPEDEPSVKVVKDVRGDEGARTTEFDILVGTRDRNVTMSFEDGGSHTFLPLAGTEDFGIAEQAIDEDGWTTAISCVSDERDGAFGARSASYVIDEIGEGEDIVCTVINTFAASSEDEPSVKVVKDVRGDEGARTTEFDILVGTRDRNVTMSFEDGGSHTFLPLAGTEDFGIAEQAIDEDGWTTAISCVSDERDGAFGARSASYVIDEIGEGEDIVCTVINTFDEGDDDDPPNRRRTTPTTQVKIETPCFDGTAENEVGECVAPEPPEVVVLGVQIETSTTIEAATTDTLPFTGDESTPIVTAGALALIAGALLLVGSHVGPVVRDGRRQVSSAATWRWHNT